MKRGKANIQVEKNLIPVKNKIKQKIPIDSKQYSYFNFWSLFALIIFIGIIAFRKYLTGEYLFFFKDIGSDSINQNYPGLVHKVTLLQESFFSKWSFYKGIGDSWVGNVTVEPYGLFRNIEELICVKLSGVNSFVNGRFLRIFIYNFLLSGIIFYFYLQSLSINKFSSVIGALLITFSGYMVVGSGWDFASHVFKAVFLLFAFEQLYIKKRWYFFPFAIIWLSSNPFTLYLYSFFLLIYSIFRYFSENNKKIKGYLQIIGKMILLGFVGIMMNFTELLKAFMKMYYSPRVAGDASYSKILSSGQEITEHGNLAGTTILRFFSNDILGTGTNFKGWSNYLEAPLFYIGLLSLLLFPQIFIYLNKRKKIIFGTFLGFWLLTIVFPYLRYSMLAFTGDYFRYGFDFFIPFVILFYAVYALNELDKTLKINLPLLFGTFLLLLIVLFFPFKLISSNIINQDVRRIVVVLLILYSGLLILMSKSEYKSISKIAILSLVVLELSYFSFKSYEERVPVTKNEFDKNMAGYNDGTIKAVEYIKQNDRSEFFRTTKDYQSGVAMHGSLNDAMAQGYYGTAQYSSFTQINYVRFLEETGIIPKGDEASTRWITGLRNYPLLLSFANVKYQLSKSENPEFTRFGFNLVNKTGDISILKNNYYLPFGYTYNKYINFDDFEHLKKYKITQFSIQNITLELQRLVPQNKVNELIQSVQPIVNKEFDSDSSFYAALKNVLLPEDFQERKFTFIRHSTQNFRNQVALLTCFVNEEGENFIDTSDLMKLNIKDTSVFVDAQYFNFDIYQKLINELKTDTFVFETFSQSRITGNIKISKPEMVFFTIPYDKSWKIKVNGKEEDLKRVNIGFSGIKLNKGNYKIELYYEPDFLKPSIIITIISNLIFWGFLVFYLIRKRRKIKS
jgi:uncharacterized membrane protein YfhO